MEEQEHIDKYVQILPELETYLNELIAPIKVEKINIEEMGDLEKCHYYKFINNLPSLTKLMLSNANYSDKNLEILYMWYHMWSELSKEEQEQKEKELYEGILGDEMGYGVPREDDIVDEETKIMSALIHGKGEEIGF